MVRTAGGGIEREPGWWGRGSPVFEEQVDTNPHPARTTGPESPSLISTIRAYASCLLAGPMMMVVPSGFITLGSRFTSGESRRAKVRSLCNPVCR